MTFKMVRFFYLNSYSDAACTPSDFCMPPGRFTKSPIRHDLRQGSETDIAEKLLHFISSRKEVINTSKHSVSNF